MKKLYISDLDGTLLNSNAELSVKTVSILNELLEQGLNFTVATARSIVSVKPLLKNMKISIPVILMNGVCIYDLQLDDYIKVETFPQKSIDLLLSVIKEYQLKGFAYTVKAGKLATYYEELNTKALQAFYQERRDRYQKMFQQIDDFTVLSGEPMMYFTLLDQKSKLEPVYQILRQIPELHCTFYKDNYTPDLWYLEIYNNTASKYHAVHFLRNKLGYDHITCFGDNSNDLPLFEAGDCKIAVGNAVSDLKEKADLIIGNNYDDGVAAWLKQNYEAVK